MRVRTGDAAAQHLEARRRADPARGEIGVHAPEVRGQLGALGLAQRLRAPHAHAHAPPRAVGLGHEIGQPERCLCFHARDSDVIAPARASRYAARMPQAPDHITTANVLGLTHDAGSTHADTLATRAARIAAGDVEFMRAELVRLEGLIGERTEQRDKARRDAAQFARTAQSPNGCRLAVNEIAIQRRLGSIAHELYGRDGARLFLTEAECDELRLG